MATPAETHFDEAARPAGSLTTMGPAAIIALIDDVDKVVEDAMSGSAHLKADITTGVVALGAAGVELGVISSQTDALAIAILTVLIASVFRILAAWRLSQKAKVKEAAFEAVGWSTGGHA
jgi:hypothetical protein